MTISTSIPIRIKRSGEQGKKPLVSDLLTGELAVNFYDGELYTLRYRPGFGSDVVKIGGAGVKVTNILYVTKDGNDNNTGQKLGEAKATIGGAIAAATTGTIIKVSAGTYVENNPISVPPQLSVVGDSLREVSIVPANIDQDLFHISPGNYFGELSFVGTLNPGKAVFAFDPNTIRYSNQSPYIRNCTNFITNSIGMKIDGNNVLGPFKSMVTDSFTQYNQNGIGVSITNEGYAQLVSLFTIASNIAIYCGSGGACDLTNSNSSFGNYGLVADGVGPLKYSGTIVSPIGINEDTFTVSIDDPTINVSNAVYGHTSGIVTVTTSTNHNFLTGMTVNISGLGFTCDSGPGIVTYPSGNNGFNFEVISTPTPNTFSAHVGVSTLRHYYYGGGEVKNNIIRPFDGQAIYFGQLYYQVSKINLINPGSGYSNVPLVTIDSPSTEWGVQAQAVPTISNGSVLSIELASSGRGYTTIPNVTITSPDVGINTSTATVTLTPVYYLVKSSTPISSGICTITISDNLPYSVGVGTTVPFFKQSRVLASGHSFEYIGSGTQIPNCLPSLGGVAIQENETDIRNGGLVVYTSTDQSGNFRIGDGVKIDQSTGTISGNIYSKSLFSTMTPFILALGGGL